MHLGTSLGTLTRTLIAGGLLLLVTLATYFPALDGKFIWDDDAHVTTLSLRSLTGFWRIWTDPRATQQYYPLTHSAFWLAYQLGAWTPSATTLSTSSCTCWTLSSCGGSLGLATAWLERRLLGAEGEDFAFMWVDRGLIAGRALWFYVGKLLWTANLIFIYPRWSIDRSAWWQYLYPAAALAVLVALGALRGRLGRGPLVAALFFGGTLVPALGFFNIYPFIYSFVADHFQYLASLSLITLAAALIASGLARLGVWQRPAGHAVCAASSWLSPRSPGSRRISTRT